MANDIEREQTVRADMESIFGQPTAWYGPQEEDAQPRRTVGASGRLNYGSAPATALAGVLLIVSIGAGITIGGSRETSPGAAARSLLPAGKANLRDLPAAYERSAMTLPPPRIIQALAERAVPAVIAPEAIGAESAAPPQGAAGTRIAATTIAFQAIPATHVRRTARDIPDDRRLARIAAEPGSDRPCDPDEDTDRCIYHDVLSADARLRIVYAAAARDGAPAGELAAVRRRWMRASELSSERPDEAIRRYDDLANTLSGGGYGPR